MLPARPSRSLCETRSAAAVPVAWTDVHGAPWRGGRKVGTPQTHEGTGDRFHGSSANRTKENSS
eukprot:2425767-Prymnesium_polylepis.2